MSTDPRRPIGRQGLPLVLVLLLVTSPAPAQAPLEPPPAPEEGVPPSAGSPLEPEEGTLEEGAEEASYFSSSLTLAAGRDSGFLAGDGEEELEDTVTVLRPSLLLLHRPSGRTELTLGYEPELQSFADHSELDAVDHAAGALLTHETTRRSRLLAGASLLDGEDPGRHLSGLLLVLPRVPYRQSRVYTGFEYRWPLTYALLHLGWTATEIAPGPGVFAGGLDQTEGSATLTVGRTLGPRTDLSASYSCIDPTYSTLVVVDDGAAPGDGFPQQLARLDEPIQTASLALGYEATPRLGFHLTGGVLEERGDLTYLAAAEVVRSGDAFAFRLRYDRSLLSLTPSAGPAGAVPAQPLPPTAAVRDSVTQSLTAGFVARPAERLRWEQELWGARTDLPGGETLDSLAASSRLVLEAMPRVGTFLEVRYLEQRGSELVGEPFSRTYLSLGVILGLTGPRRSWGVREAPDRLHRVLPNRS